MVNVCPTWPQKGHGTSNHGNETKGTTVTYAMRKETLFDAGRPWSGIRIAGPDPRADTCRVLRLIDQEDKTMTSRLALLPLAVLLMAAMPVKADEPAQAILNASDDQCFHGPDLVDCAVKPDTDQARAADQCWHGPNLVDCATAPDTATAHATGGTTSPR